MSKFNGTFDAIVTYNLHEVTISSKYEETTKNHDLKSKPLRTTSSLNHLHLGGSGDMMGGG